MKKLSLISLAAAAALAITPAAFTQSFDFSYSDPGDGIYANGTLSGTQVGIPGEYLITGGTITISGAVNASGTVDPNTGDDGGSWDNLFYALDNAPGRPGPSYLTSLGLLFSTNTGYAGIWNGDNNGNGSGYSLNYSTYDIVLSYAPNAFTISAPEGGAALLYLLLAGGTCFGAMSLISRKRFANLAAA